MKDEEVEKNLFQERNNISEFSIRKHRMSDNRDPRSDIFCQSDVFSGV